MNLISEFLVKWKKTTTWGNTVVKNFSNLMPLVLELRWPFQHLCSSTVSTQIYHGCIVYSTWSSQWYSLQRRTIIYGFVLGNCSGKCRTLIFHEYYNLCWILAACKRVLGARTVVPVILWEKLGHQLTELQGRGGGRGTGNWFNHSSKYLAL